MQYYQIVTHFVFQKKHSMSKFPVSDTNSNIKSVEEGTITTSNTITFKQDNTTLWRSE